VILIVLRGYKPSAAGLLSRYLSNPSPGVFIGEANPRLSNELITVCHKLFDAEYYKGASILTFRPMNGFLEGLSCLEIGDSKYSPKNTDGLLSFSRKKKEIQTPEEA